MAFEQNFERSRLLYNPHNSARKVQAKIGKACRDDYYTFCFDRNPWERTISDFYFAPKNRDVAYATDQQVYSYLIRRMKKRKSRCNSRLYTNEKGEVMVDDIFDFSDLDKVMLKLCDRFGFDYQKFSSFPKFKGSIRLDRRPYRDYLSPKTVGLISEIHHKAISIMGYLPDVAYR